MNPKLRALLSVLGGVIAGSFIILGAEMLSPFHPPADMNYNDRATMGACVKTLPMSAFLFLLMAYLLGSLVAGYITNWLSRPTHYRPALIAGTSFMASGFANLIDIPHPIWFGIVSSLVFLAGAWVGGKVAVNGEKIGEER